MAAFTSTIAINAEQLSNSPQLEPAFEHLLRNSNVHESIISTLRINAITDRDTFVHMFDSEAALKDGASDLGFDLTAGGLPHKREFARVVTSWKTAKIMVETKLQTDAVAKAHGLPVTLLPCDWTSILTEFKKKYGSQIPDDRLPAQSMFEHFSEKLADGTLKAEPLSHVVSLFEEEQQQQQDMKKPDPSRQYNLQLDSRLTITTKRRHLSSEPTDEKGSRLKYAIMTNLWLLAQMRQPWRSIYQDLDRCTFNDFLDTLLDRDNFNFYKEVEGCALITPSWTYCLSYEFELRKDAFRLCKEQQYGIQAAPGHFTQHRTSYEALAPAHRASHTPSSSSARATVAEETYCRFGKGPLQISPRKGTETSLLVLVLLCLLFLLLPLALKG